MKIVIFGAGPCGLTAAWELAKKGASVTVIEKDNQVGGLCRTVRRNGFQFDLGGHRFISKDIDLIKDIQNLMQDELLVRERKSVIRFCDHEYDYPLNLKNVLSKSSLWMNVKFTKGYLQSLFKFKNSSAPQNSFEKWGDDKFGKELTNYFFKPYTEKLWGISAEKLSDDWADQRISTLDGKNLLLNLLGLIKQKQRSFAKKYFYPKGGIGAIFEFMAKDIQRLGGEIITNAELISLQTKENRVTYAFVKQPEMEEKLVQADCFLSTIPIDTLLQLLGKSKPQSLPYRSLRFLNILLKKEDISPNTWIYVPEKHLIMTRIQEPKKRSPWSAPVDTTSVMLEIPCQKGDSIWTMDDEELLEKAIKDLKALKIDISKEVIGFFSTYASHAYPRYEIGYKEKVSKMIQEVDTFENLHTLGRQGLFRYIFMDTAMLMGKHWAQSILNHSSDKFIYAMGTEKTLYEVYTEDALAGSVV